MIYNERQRTLKDNKTMPAFLKLLPKLFAMLSHLVCMIKQKQMNQRNRIRYWYAERKLLPYGKGPLASKFRIPGGLHLWEGTLSWITNWGFGDPLTCSWETTGDHGRPHCLELRIVGLEKHSPVPGRPRETAMSWTTDLELGEARTCSWEIREPGRTRETTGDHTVLNYGFGVWKSIHLFLGDHAKPRKTTGNHGRPHCLELRICCLEKHSPFLTGDHSVLNYGFCVWKSIHLFLGDQGRPRETTMSWTKDLVFGKAFSCPNGRPHCPELRIWGLKKAFTCSWEIREPGRPRETTGDHGRPHRLG